MKVNALALTPDGQGLAYVGNRETAYHNRATGQTEHTRPQDDYRVRTLAVRYSPDGRYVIDTVFDEKTGKSRVSVRDAKSHELLGRSELTGAFPAVEVAADGKRMFVGGTGKGGHLFLVVLGLPDAKEIERDTDPPIRYGGPRISPDGVLLATVTVDGTVGVWDRARKRVIADWAPHPEAKPETVPGIDTPVVPRTRVAFAPDGRTLATARGSQIRIWDLAPTPKAAPPADPGKGPTPEEAILADIERRIDPANTDGKSLPFALLEHNGVAALRFGKWRLVFEGVPCDSGGKVLFGVGAFFLPNTGGRANFADPGLKAPAPALRQQSTGRANEIVLKNYRFELEAKGARLVFADKTYEATDRVQTIVIARDGTTRLEPAK
jgi:hypothetical protein